MTKISLLLLWPVAGFIVAPWTPRRGPAPLEMGRGGSLRPRERETRRQSRYAQVVRSELAKIIRDGYDVRPQGKKHPSAGLREKINVVDCDVSPDLANAAVIISIFTDSELEKREAFAWLVRNRT